MQVAALALLAAAFPSTGHAVDFTADLTPDTTRYLSDPSFLPLQGQIYSETVYTHTDRSEDFHYASGFGYLHFSSNIDHYSQYFSYGVTDRLSLSASGSYSDESDHYSFTVGSSAPKRNDFDNPTFGATYRAIEQTDSPVSIDVTGSYSPAAVDQSSQSGTIGLHINRETKFLTIQGEFSATYIDQYDGLDSLTATRHDGYWNYLAGLRSQMRLTDQFALDSGVVYSKNSDIQYDGGFFRDSQDGTWTPYVALTYDIIPARVNLAFEYDHRFNGDDQRSSSFVGGPNGKWVNDNENLYAVHLRLLF